MFKMTHGSMRSASLAALAAFICSASPAMGGSNFPPSAYTQAAALLAKLNNTQKIALVHGFGQGIATAGYVGSTQPLAQFGIPPLNLEDGPQGVADLVPGATAYPSALTVAMTWDVNLAYTWGEAMGAEQAIKGTNVMLGPGTNLARVPWGGRVFEYFSGEDPVLGQKLLPSEIAGIQSNNIAANIKHFIMNNQEYDRNSASANVGQRAFMELYTRPFQAAVDSGVGSAMCSYNRINNTYACENNATLSWLKDTAGFDGWVMSDWGATHSTVNAALTGLDQEMPDSQYFGDALAAAVAAGEVPQSRLDDMVYRIFVAMYATGMMQNPPTGNLSANAESTARRDLARQLAEESTTLLKNDGNLLPLDLSSTRSIAILGDAVTFYGGGSGGVLAPYIVTLYEALSLRLNGQMPPTRTLNCTYINNADFNQPPVPCYDGIPSAQACADFCNQDSTCNAFTWVPNQRCNGWGSNSGMCYIRPDASGQTSKGGNVAGICSPAPSGAAPGNKVNFTFYAGFDPQVAASLAAAADIAIVSVAISSSEGSDRTNLSVPDWQDAVVSAVAAAQPNTVAVARCPGACFMPWAADVPAILFSLLPGQEAATALANILVGDVTPSGKLPVSFPANMSDTWLGNPVNPEQYPGTQRTNSWIEADYSEGLFIGYRWYDSTGIKPLWPFGHGLSYANFTYSNLQVKGTPSPSSNVTVTFRVANVGDADGQEVPQLYIGYPAAANEPPKLLKDFTKVVVESGSQQQITFTLTAAQLSVFDVPSGSWMLVPGTYTVLVGSSSADIRLTSTFTA